MKISNKRELHQIELNHSSDVDFKDSMKIDKNVLQNHILFWLILQPCRQMIFYDLERIF